MKSFWLGYLTRKHTSLSSLSSFFSHSFSLSFLFRFAKMQNNYLISYCLFSIPFFVVFVLLFCNCYCCRWMVCQTTMLSDSNWIRIVLQNKFIMRMTSVSKEREKKNKYSNEMTTSQKTGKHILQSIHRNSSHLGVNGTNRLLCKWIRSFYNSFKLVLLYEPSKSKPNQGKLYHIHTYIWATVKNIILWDMYKWWDSDMSLKTIANRSEPWWQLLDSLCVCCVRACWY